MSAPRYFGDNVEEFLLEWSAIANQLFGLHARLSFERLIVDMHQVEVRHALTLRDLHRDIESLEEVERALSCID